MEGIVPNINHVSYLYSRLAGNDSGLASADENGRVSPNVNCYYDNTT